MGSPYRLLPFGEQADSKAPTDLIPDNGQVERFVQTNLHEWAYARATTLPGNAPLNFLPGSTATTGIDRMAVSTPNRQSADSA
jgi:hypothetical protein